MDQHIPSLEEIIKLQERIRKQFDRINNVLEQRISVYNLSTLDVIADKIISKINSGLDPKVVAVHKRKSSTKPDSKPDPKPSITFVDASQFITTLNDFFYKWMNCSRINPDRTYTLTDEEYKIASSMPESRHEVLTSTTDSGILRIYREVSQEKILTFYSQIIPDEWEPTLPRPGIINTFKRDYPWDREYSSDFIQND